MGDAEEGDNVLVLQVFPHHGRLVQRLNLVHRLNFVQRPSLVHRLNLVSVGG